MTNPKIHLHQNDLPKGLNLGKEIAVDCEMMGLNLHRDQPAHLLAADLRRAFSGIVAGNVKEDGMRRIEQFGPFEIHGDADMMQSLDALLRAFVQQRRMKIAGEYKPCYRVVA